MQNEIVCISTVFVIAAVCLCAGILVFLVFTSCFILKITVLEGLFISLTCASLSCLQTRNPSQYKDV